MKLIKSHTGRVIIRLSFDDIKPDSGYALQDVVNSIQFRYSFAPPTQQMMPIPFINGGIPVLAINLTNGKITVKDQTIFIKQICMTNDLSFITIDSDTTEQCEIVFDDIISLLEASYGFRNIKSNSTFGYGSGIIVEFDEKLEKSFRILGRIEALLNPVFQKTHGITNSNVKFERLQFQYDPSELSPIKAQMVGAFTLERRAAHPYSEDRYFSGAPLKTSEHIKLLEQIEKVICEDEA